MNRIQRQKEYFNDVTEKWIKVNKYLEMIFIDRTPLDGKKMMEFHQLVYYHCCCFSEDPGVKSQDAGTSFYDSTIRFLNERLWVVSRELELITNNEQLLIKYLEHWDMYRKSCEVLNCGCRFFNQNWVRFENSGKRVDIVHDIYRTAIIQWMDVVFRPVDRSLVNAITSLIRRTDQQERIHMVLQSIVELYANDENQTVSVPNKLNNVFDTAVVDLYKRRTFIKFQKTLGSNGFTDFRHFLKYACLAMPEIEKGNQFKDFLKSHITHKLNEAVRKSPRCKDSKIEAILAVRNSRLGRSIGGHKELKDIMNKSVAVILAKYGDDLMKDKKVEEADLKNEYQQIVKIVESMNEIKLFIRRYRDYLRSRLIGETCVSLNRESMMVGWLTDKFGDETIILRIFLINFQTSNSFNDQLQAYLSTRNLGFEFHLNYFKQDRMEVVENFNLVLPWEIQQAVEELRQYQFIKHPRKKIEFDFSNSFGIITYNLGESSYNFSVNTFQMVILMQFNIFQRLTIEQLLGNLNMTLDILEWVSFS
ncbi:hypothetical protein KR074_009239 [Drosophila pseudoananassae]|nr:hypothetical protein KR074_009239 [Drosophila pseudoananassae]